MYITDFTSQHVNGLWTCTVTVTECGTSYLITGYECPDESIKLDSCSCGAQHCRHIAFAREGLNATAQAAYQERLLIAAQDARIQSENLAYHIAGIVPVGQQAEQEAA